MPAFAFQYNPPSRGEYLVMSAKFRIDCLAEFMLDGRAPPDIRIKAASLLLARAYGKPPIDPGKPARLAEVSSLILAKVPEAEYEHLMSDLPPPNDTVVTFPSGDKLTQMSQEMYPATSGKSKEVAATGKVIHDIRTAARAYAERALETLNSIMLDPLVSANHRIDAADKLLDRGFGKPRQEIVGAEGAPLIPDYAPGIRSLSPDKRMVLRHVLEEVLADAPTIEAEAQ